MRKPDRSFALAFLCLIVALSVAVVWPFVNVQPDAGVVGIAEHQKASLEVMKEMNKYAISLALLIFGGFGALLTTKEPVIDLSDRWQLILGTLSLSAATISLYASWVVYDSLVIMLNVGFFNPANSIIARPIALQVGSLLAAVVFMASTLLVSRRTAGTTETHHD